MDDLKTIATTSFSSVRNELLFVLAGLVFSAGLVAANQAIASVGDIDFLSVFHWVWLPTGPMMGGMAAAGGYYFVAKYTNTLPSKRLLFEIVALGATTWFIYRYWTYQTLTLEGVDVSSRIDFLSYMQYIIPNAQYVPVSGGAKEAEAIGDLGYLREAISVIGMCAGSYIVYEELTKLPTCLDCRRYREVSTVSGELTLEQYDKLVQEHAWQFGNLIERSEAFVNANASLTKVNGFTTHRLSCSSCFNTLLRWSIVWTGKNGQQEQTPIYTLEVENDLLKQLKADSEGIIKRYPTPSVAKKAS